MDSLHAQGKTSETPTNQAIPTQMNAENPPPIYQHSQNQNSPPTDSIKQTGGETNLAHTQPIQSPVQQTTHVPQKDEAHLQQNHGNTQTFKSATPLINLGEGAAPVDCPACGQRSITRVEYETGNTTHVFALILCCVSLCCISYMLNGTKDVQHRCGRCGALLATWKRNGNTVVHLFE